ncbi:glycosyltransferase [uncultured Ilyobacter sp.]|uniref:glycosyltransferase n=1 Tax=uncultured Ilyobacter sp. TaxID=544433 RepID=UPI002AA75C8F|nr:glycosyltransferase [uncultured Ilyobacter sp.]
MKRKLAIVIPSLRGGGAERVMLNIISHLNREEFNIRLIVIKKEGPYEKKIPSDIDVVDLNSNRVRYSILKLIKELNKFKPDVILSTLGHLNLVLLSIRAFLKSKPKIIVREANTPSKSLTKLPKLKRKIFIYLYGKLYPTSDVVIAQCKEMKKDIINSFGVPDNKIIYIYNPIDLKSITEESTEFNPYDRNYINIVSVGRLTYQKGFDILIKAFQKVVLEVPNARLSILGDGELREELTQLINKLKLEDFIKIVGFKENPYPYYKYASLYVLSSRWEGFPNTLLEALACGTNVVATDCKSGPREILEDIGNYGLVEEDDDIALAEMMISVLKTKKINDRSIIEKYDTSNIIKLYEKTLLK